MNGKKLRNKSLIENIKRFNTILHSAEEIIESEVNEGYAASEKNSFTNIYNILSINWTALEAELYSIPSTPFNIVYAEYCPISANDLYQLSSERYSRFKQRWLAENKQSTLTNKLDEPASPSVKNPIEDAEVLERAEALDTNVTEHIVGKDKKTILHNGQLYSKKQIKIINRGRDPEYKTYANIDDLSPEFSASEMKVISKYRLLEVILGTEKLLVTLRGMHNQHTDEETSIRRRGYIKFISKMIHRD